MTCPKCGANCKKNVDFCPSCGEKLPEVQQEFKGVASNKNEFVKHVAGPAIQRKDRIRKILSVACVVLLLLCYLIVTNISIEKVAIIKRASGGATLDREKEDIRDVVEGLYEELDANEDKFSKKDVKLMKKFLKSADKLSKRFSINNLKKFTKRLGNLEDTDIAEQLGVSNLGLKDITDYGGKAMNTVTNFFLIFTLICAAFVFLGGWFRFTAMIVVGLILTLIFTWLFCGFLWLLLNLALHIVLIACNSAVNKEYGHYRGAVAYK